MSTDITNIVDFRAQLARFLDSVQVTRKPVLVVKHGDPVAAVIPGDELEAYQQWKDQAWLFTDAQDQEELAKFDALSKRVEEEWQGKNRGTTVTQEEIDALSF